MKKLRIEQIEIKSFITGTLSPQQFKGGLRPDSEPWCSDYATECYIKCPSMDFGVTCESGCDTESC